MRVKCPATITSPAVHPAFTAMTGLGSNEPCPEYAEVIRPAPAMEMRCPLGHHFIASEDQIEPSLSGDEG